MKSRSLQRVDDNQDSQDNPIQIPHKMTQHHVAKASDDGWDGATKAKYTR